MDCMVSSRTPRPRFAGAGLRGVAWAVSELGPCQRMAGRVTWAEETRVVKIRRTEGQERLGALQLDYLPEAGADVVRVAIVEGGQAAIGGSFPSCALLAIHRLELSDSKFRKQKGTRLNSRTQRRIWKRKGWEWRKEENKAGEQFKEGRAKRRREGAEYSLETRAFGISPFCPLL